MAIVGIVYHIYDLSIFVLLYIMCNVFLCSWLTTSVILRYVFKTLISGADIYSCVLKSYLCYFTIFV